MKRFTSAAAVFGVSILAVWAIFQLFAASQHQAKNGNTPAQLQPAQNEIMKAIGSNKTDPETGVESKSVAPVFDSTGALVSDPSGAMLDASSSDANMAVAPLFDASGSVISNPSGLPITGPDLKVAPVIDANGRVVSDPSGTILNASNP